MTIGLHHQWTLLALDEATGKSRIKDSYFRTYGLAGALCAELQLRDRLVPAAANRFAIVDHGAPAAGALGSAEAALAGRRPRSEARLISILGNHRNRLRRETLAELVALGALREEQDRLWIITWRRRWPEANPELEQELVEHLRSWLDTVQPEAPPSRNDLLLSLLRSAKNLDRLWNEPELAARYPKIVERTSRAPVGHTVKKVVDSAKAAAAAAAAGT